MEIKWYGGSAVICKLSNNLIYFDFPKEKISEPKNKKQIIIYTEPESISFASKHQDRFVIDTPGEYEISDTEIKVIPVNNRNIVELKNQNITLVNFNLDSIPEESIIKNINGANILLISVGKGALNARDASEISNKIEPDVLIPIHFQNLQDAENFLKNENFNLNNILDIFKYNSAEINPEERKNVLLKPQKL